MEKHRKERMVIAYVYYKDFHCGFCKENENYIGEYSS